ncbi:MAG: hypothetical protein HOK67_06040 [Deltaproteobacteria bacterium]|jgi:hypothetical protein|nr:hypothetical protein [Deltaproteobacteria bacterium]
MARTAYHSKNWGGKREGSGRNTEDPTVPISLTLPMSLLMEIEAISDKTGEYRSEVITRLLRTAVIPECPAGG